MFGTMFSNAAAFVNPALAQMMNSIPYDVEVMNNLNLNYHINEYSFPYN